MASKNISGTGVALITPFKKDLSVDYKSLEKLVHHVIDGGVNYLVVMGTTGEAVTLSAEEQRGVLDKVLEVSNNKIPVVFGMGGYNTMELVHKIKKFNFKGISALLNVTPYYNKPNQTGIKEHYKLIAAESPVPVIMYNVPGRTGVNMTAETSLALAHECKNIIAVKEASGNLSQVMHIIQNKPKNFQVISGDDNLTFPMITVGCSGVISVVANAYPKSFSNMVNSALKGNVKDAAKLHYQLLDFSEVIFNEGSPAGIKSALHNMKIIENYLRLPLVPASKNLYLKIAEIIHQNKLKS